MRNILLFAIAVVSVAVATFADDGKQDEPKMVEMKGTLETGVVAIGGETTGTTIKTKEGTFELDLSKDKDLREKAHKLKGKEVTVSGTLVIKKGIEIKHRKIITVTALEEVK